MRAKPTTEEVPEVSIGWFLGVALALSVGLLSIVYVLAKVNQIPLAMLVRDPAQMYRYNPFVGFLSYLGILMWGATSTLCFFTFALIPGSLRGSGQGTVRVFLLVSGLFTFILLLDDLFVFHEGWFPHVFSIPENIVYVIYAVLFCLYLWTFRLHLLRYEYRVLFLAGCFFAASIGYDMVFPQKGIHYFFEDGLKFLGIVTWMVFFIRVCQQEIRGLTLKR